MTSLPNGGGVDSSRRDAHTAQRMSVFQLLIPVMTLRDLSCALPRGVATIVWMGAFMSGEVSFDDLGGFGFFVEL